MSIEQRVGPAEQSQLAATEEAAATKAAAKEAAAKKAASEATAKEAAATKAAAKTAAGATAASKAANASSARLGHAWPSGLYASSAAPGFIASAGDVRAASRAGSQLPAIAASSPSVKNAMSGVIEY